MSHKNVNRSRPRKNGARFRRMYDLIRNVLKLDNLIVISFQKQNSIIIHYFFFSELIFFHHAWKYLWLYAFPFPNSILSTNVVQNMHSSKDQVSPI